jgi:hypothetical protein
MKLFERIYGCVIFAVVGIITLIIFIDCLRTHYYGWELGSLFLCLLLVQQTSIFMQEARHDLPRLDTTKLSNA